MKRILAPMLLVVALLGVAVAGWWLKRPAEAVAVACVDPLVGCSFSHRGTPASVRFSTQPAPMQVFEVYVSAPGAARVSAEFQMVGMDMGFNRYGLKPAGTNAFAARATLPVCVSGRRDWQLYLDVDGARYAVPFSTR